MTTNPTATHAPACECRLCWLAANDPRYQRLWGIRSRSNKPRVNIADLAQQRRH